MEPVDRVIVELEAKLDRYNADIARAEAKFDKAMKGIQKNAGATEAFVARAAGVMSGALAGVSVLALARGFLTLADEAKKLDAQLRLATAGFGSFGQAQEDVRRIADETRSGLSETASLYGNFVRGAKELGASQAEAARATETFSKTLKISGADANQAASATLQFGQALASGALRGDELNSILEASPRLARLLAEAMGQPIGQIKKLGEEGLLTSDKLLKALTDKKFTAGIDAEFREIPVTFDEAMTKVYNAAVITFGAFDRGGEFSTMLANFVSDGADGFADLEASAENFGVSVRGTLEGLGDAFTPMLEAGREAFRLLGIDLSNFSSTGRKEIAGILGAFDDLLNIGPSIANFLGADGKYDSRLQADFLKSAEKSDIQRRMALIMATDPLRDAPPRPGTGKSVAAAPSGKKDKPNKSSGPTADEIAFRNASEQRQLDAEIIRAKIDLATDIDERAQLERELLAIEKAQRFAELDADKEIGKKARAAREKSLVELYGARSGATGSDIVVGGGGLVSKSVDRDVDEQRRQIAIDALSRERAALEAEAELAPTRRARLDAELAILGFLDKEERDRLEQQIASGQITDAVKARADLERAIAARRQGVIEKGAGPLARRARELETTDIGDEVERYAVEELQHFQDGLRNAITKKLGIKDPFLASLLDLFIQQNIIKPLTQALAGANGGGGDVVGSLVAGAKAIFGFSGGGSGTIGGMGGTDTNTLSLNGQPFANVSRGETLSIGSKALNSRSSATIVQPIIQVDARGAVMNDQFASMILSQANQTAASMVQAGGRAINANIPNRIAQFQRDGT